MRNEDEKNGVAFFGLTAAGPASAGSRLRHVI